MEFDYDPPSVKWVRDGYGLHPIAALDPDASDLTKLRHEATLVRAWCGVDCRIGQLTGPDTYDYAVYLAHGPSIAGGNCGTYQQAREFLHGLQVGALAKSDDGCDECFRRSISE